MVLIAKKQKALPIHHRKRHAQHHKRSKHYDKPYWPYLPLLGIIGIGFIFNLLWTPLSQTVFSKSNVLSFATDTSIAGLLEATNEQRNNNGAGSLQLNAQLNAAAQTKANDMATRNYWSHETPDGIQPWQFISNTGYTYTAAGENLAYGFGSNVTTVAGWMNSPSHRANLLNTTFEEVGFGLANAEDFQGNGQQTIVVAMYGTPAVHHISYTGSQNAPATSTKQQAPIAVNTNTPAPLPALLPASGSAPSSEASEETAGDSAATPASGTPLDSTQNADPTTAMGRGNGDTKTPAPAAAQTIPQESRRVARLQLALASTTIPLWSVPVILSLVVAAMALFVSRHVVFAHRAIVRGERFIVKHAALDIAIVCIITIGVLITRTAGFIQ